MSFSITGFQMHILYLCKEYPPYPHGGIGSFVQLMARQLVQRGHTVSVVGLYQIAEFKQENDVGVNVYRLPAGMHSPFHVLFDHHNLYRFILNLYAAVPVDLVEGSELSFGLLPAKLPSKKIIRIHGGHHFFSNMLGLRMRLSTRLIEKRSFAHTDYFCAVSLFAAETTRKLMRLRDFPIEVLPNPVDTRLFRPFPEIPAQDGLIVFTGGLREKKGIRQLIQAMSKVIEKKPCARLWIHGADTKDHTGQSFLHRLEKEIDPAIASHIEFRGAVPHNDLPRINAQASVLVYPSWMETQGIVVIEGMASRRPVIASQTGPGPELITDGLDGLLCDPYSPKSIAEKIILLLKDSELREKLADNARNKAEELFSVDMLVEKNLAFYEACLAQS